MGAGDWSRRSTYSQDRRHIAHTTFPNGDMARSDQFAVFGFCSVLYGKPTEDHGWYAVWDVSDGNVVLQKKCIAAPERPSTLRQCLLDISSRPTFCCKGVKHKALRLRPADPLCSHLDKFSLQDVDLRSFADDRILTTSDWCLSNGKGHADSSTWPLFMSATTYSPTHFRVQYNRPGRA